MQTLFTSEFLVDPPSLARRIVLMIGCAMSLGCVALIIILEVGSR